MENRTFPYKWGFYRFLLNLNFYLYSINQLLKFSILVTLLDLFEYNLLPDKLF